ncbi:hypothetical protein ACHAXS_004676 [Conticribra weissflogii]
MFVDGIPFLVTTSRNVKFITTEHIPIQTTTQLKHSLTRVVHLYARAGFVIQTILVDGQFEPLKNHLLNVVVNTTASSEHVGEVERCLRVIKERARAITSGLPYRRMPKRILIELINFVVFWLNAFPAKNGISNTVSPKEIVTRQQVDYNKHCKAEFGCYCEVFDDPTPSNTLTPRTQPAICLGPTGNLQGTYKFFSLRTGLVLKRRQFKCLPMPDSMISTLNNWEARGEHGNLIFANRRGIPFTWNRLREHNTPRAGKAQMANFPNMPAELPGIAIEQAEAAHTANVAEEEEAEAQEVVEDTDLDREVPHLAFGQRDENLEDYDIGDVDMVPLDDADEQQLINDITNNTEYNAATGQIDELIHDLDQVQGEIDQELEQLQAIVHPPEQVEQVRRSSRTTRGQRQNPRYDEEYELLNTHDNTRREITSMDELEITEHIIGVVFTQYSLRAGLRRFKEKGEQAIKQELQQLHDMDVFVPVPESNLSADQKRKALSTVTFIKEKRDKRVKGRVCADGRKQREEFSREEAASPTVTNESVFLTGVIDAKEHRDVATVDITGAYLHAINDHDVHMVLEGKLAELMDLVAPHIYRKHITTNKNGQPMLYVRLHKALYGLLKSALLFYKKLCSDLSEQGFKINPYDPCVANKTVNGEQLTVLWHVDDLKISHRETVVVTNFINWLGTKYTGLTINRGKRHDYLGMDLDYTTPGVLTVSMEKYTKKIIDEFPELITTPAATPAADHLFQVRDNPHGRQLPEQQAVIYHHTVAQLLFLSARARRDIQTAVAFLTTRVKNPDEDDWGKLKRVLKYLKGTPNLGMRLTADATPVVKWWVDASHVVHNDCKSHTGASMSMGKGMAITISRKQKINGKSSTESEIIAVDDALLHILWTKYFLECQGYHHGPSVLHQDNKSALLLETNGLRSASKRTKHIKVRYFFVKDKVDQNEIVLRYCPTEQMWADVLTKPKQGQAFREFRSKIMNVPIDIPIDGLDGPLKPTPRTRKHWTKPNVSAQECVGVRTNCTMQHNQLWPLILLGGTLWDPNKYVKMLSQGMTRRLACTNSFLK